MFYSKILIFFLFILTMVGCNSKQQKNGEVLNIELQNDVQSEKSLMSLFSIDDAIIVNPVAFQDFGEVNACFLIGDSFLVHTAFPQTVSIINRDGMIVKQIQPDYQIKEITSVDIYGNNIFILDRSAFLIHILNESLEIVGHINIPVFSQSFKILNEYQVALYTGNEVTESNSGKLIIYNYQTKKILRDFLPISEKQRKYFNFYTRYHFPVIGESVYFWDSSINDMYQVFENEIVPVFTLDYGPSKLPAGYYEQAEFQNPADFVMTLRKTDYAYRHFKFLSNQNFILITYEKGGDFLTTLYDLSNAKSLTFKNFKDDLYGLDNFNDIKLSFFIGLYDYDRFIGFLPYELLVEANVKDETLARAKEQQKNVILLGSFK
jgi:hypothetical protein